MMSTALAQAHPDHAVVWDTINAYQRTAALRAADELDLFTAIGEGIDCAEELARRCNASVRGVRILCDYLTIIGCSLRKTTVTGLHRRARLSWITIPTRAWRP